ncbi:hypothetical protein R1flu_017111 [Riccia fluitans]|uniref:Uncharacterized protein n=1 Tax=Riccia fluitans TaxID=41844 RepID=A0ABD1YPL0_9MARC
MVGRWRAQQHWKWWTYHAAFLSMGTMSTLGLWPELEPLGKQLTLFEAQPSIYAQLMQVKPLGKVFPAEICGRDGRAMESTTALEVVDISCCVSFYGNHVDSRAMAGAGAIGQAVDSFRGSAFDLRPTHASEATRESIVVVAPRAEIEQSSSEIMHEDLFRASIR